MWQVYSFACGYKKKKTYFLTVTSHYWNEKSNLIHEKSDICLICKSKTKQNQKKMKQKFKVTFKAFLKGHGHLIQKWWCYWGSLIPLPQHRDFSPSFAPHSFFLLMHSLGHGWWWAKNLGNLGWVLGPQIWMTQPWLIQTFWKLTSISQIFSK